MKHYVYKHVRLDTSEIFYIGVGSKTDKYRPYRRANCKKQRSSFWKNVYNKTDIEIILVKDNLTKKNASKIEKDLIKLYGRRCKGKGCLVNLDEGGYEGYEGYTAKQVSCYNIKTGKLIKTFSSGVKACNEYKPCTSGSIYDAIHNNGRQTSAGMQWRYGDKKKITLHKSKKYKKVQQICKKSNTVLNVYNSISEAARSLNLSVGSLGETCKTHERGKGRRKTCGGFIWKYLN